MVAHIDIASYNILSREEKNTQFSHINIKTPSQPDHTFELGKVQKTS